MALRDNRYSSCRSRAGLGAKVSAIALAAGLGGLPAMAQTQTQTQAESGSFQLEEIVVTARRYSESVQDAPVAINVMTAEDLVSRRIETVDDVIQNTPGATFLRFSKVQPEYNIRGVNANAEGTSLEAAIVSVIDDVVISKDILKNPAMFDMQRVEVLRGPQGTTFGRNASAGLIHMVSRRPEFELGAGVSVGGGSHGRFETDGYVNIPLTDTFAARLAYNFDTYDGFTESVSTGKGLDGQENIAVRGSFLFQPSDRLSVYLKAEYNEDDDETPVRRSRNGDIPQLVGLDRPDLRAEFGSPPTPPWPTTFFDPKDPWKTEISDGDFFLKREMFNLTNEIAWEFADGYTLTNVIGYIEGETDRLQEAHGTPEDVLFQRGIQDAEIFTEELRIDNHGTASRLRWLAGVFYLTDEHDRFDENQFFQNGAAGRPDTRDTKISTNETDSIGLFGELSYDITDSLTAVGGVRWAHDEKDFTIAHTAFGFGGPISQIEGCNFNPGPPTDPNTNFICGDADNPVGFATPIASEDSWEDLMFKASLEYQMNADNMFYFLFSQGYKAGGFQPEPPTVETAGISFDEETSNNYEIGWKADFGGRARLSVTGFLLSYSDLQLSQFVDTGTGFFQLVGNAGSSESMGIEAEASIMVTSDFRLNGSVALQDVELKDDVNPPGNTRGIRPDNAPKWTLNFSAIYDFHLDGGSTLTARADYRGRSNVWDDIINRELTQPGDSTKPMRLRPAAHVFDARLTWTSDDGRISASMWGKNLFEEKEILNIGPPQPNTVDRPTAFGAPRHWGGTVSYNF